MRHGRVLRGNRAFSGIMILAVLLCAASVQAVDYYIDGANGSNTSGDGTLGTPWKNISYAIKKTEDDTTDDVFHMTEYEYTNDPSLPIFDREIFPMNIRPGTQIIGAGSGKTIITANFVSDTTSRFIQGVADTDITDILIQGITFRDNNVTNNLIGSAINLTEATGAIRDCEFINCQTNGNGGAVFINGLGNSYSFEITDCLFKDCKAAGANSGECFGGLLIKNSKVKLLNSTFLNCRCRVTGAAQLIDFEGEIKGNTFISNVCDYSGPGGLFIINGKELDIANNVFDGNTGNRTYGNAISINETSTGRIHHNTFTNAKTGYNDRAVLGLYKNCDFEIDNNNFTYNYANTPSNVSGAIYLINVPNEIHIHHNTFIGNNGSNCGSLRIQNSQALVEYNTFDRNKGGSYGAVYAYSNSVAHFHYNQFTANLTTAAQAISGAIGFSQSQGDFIGNTFSNNVTPNGSSCLNLLTYQGNIMDNLFQANRCNDAVNDFVILAEYTGDIGQLSQIANNFIVDNSGNGVSLKGGSTDSKFFVNNTLANQTWDHLHINTEEWNIFNNIFHGGRTCIVENADMITNLENNLFYNFKRHLYLDNAQDSYDDILSFEFWKDEAQNNIDKTDPKFVNPEDFDYHLSPASPAIDAGYDGSNHAPGSYPPLDHDFDGNFRPIDVAGINNNGNYEDYDIGADEYVSDASFTINGFVTDSDGNPIADVDIALGDLFSAYTDTAKTAADGSYSFTSLGQSKYRLVPSKTGLAFWPHYREVTLTYGDKKDVNFEGQPTFLRGTVLNYYGAPVPGVTVIISTVQPDIQKSLLLADVSTTLTTNAQGQFNATIPAGDGYYIKVSKDTYKTKILYDVSAPNDLIIYLDSARPAPPKGLQAWGSPQGCRIKWLPSPEPSVAGYNIYYDTNRNGHFSERVSDILIKENSVEHTEDLIMGTTYYYKATAVSVEGLESQKTDWVSAKAGSINIFVKETRGPAGGKVRIPISLSEASGISCTDLLVTFSYDTSVLTPTKFEKTILTNDFNISSNISENPAGTLIFTGQCSSEQSIRMGTGRIIDIYFDVAAEAVEDSQTALSFGDVTLKDSKGVNVILTKIGAHFTVAGDYIEGDVDGDGDVDMDDARLAQKIAVDLVLPTNLQMAAGDINCDQIMDAADVSLILRIADSLPLNPEGTVPAPSSIYFLSIGRESAEAGGLVDVPITLKPHNQLCGMDLGIIYDPSSVTPTTINMHGDISSDYIMEKNMNNDGRILVTISNKENASSSDTVTLFTITFSVAPTVANTVIPLVWMNGQLSRHFGQKVTWDGAAVRLVNGFIYIGVDPWLSFEQIVNFIVGKEYPNLVESILADYNRDAILDAGDLELMIIEGHGPAK
jgi:carboxypeptidase family protein/cohesin domain-containing protein